MKTNGLLKKMFPALCCILFPLLFCRNDGRQIHDPIDRETLVRRHIPILEKADKLSPFTVGNGEFAYTVDVTGLQSFPDFYEDGIPLCTQSDWGWHTIPGSTHYKLDQASEYRDTYGRPVPYASKQNGEAGAWLRANPHRLNLGRIGLRIVNPDGSEAGLKDIQDIHQTVDIWDGIIRSAFRIGGQPINVETACHPDADQIAVRIRSRLLGSGRIGVRFDFPYGSTAWGKNASDWDSPQKHSSEIVYQSDQSVVLKRTLDSDVYYASVQWKGSASFERTSAHSFILAFSGINSFGFVCRFSKEKLALPFPDTEGTLQASKIHWKDFWETGGAVDLSGSEDPRAWELERRIVLSRYLTAIQCAGSLPPQETGLTCNSWYGKFHLEMHWWHAAHYALWGHPELLEKSLGWYETILPEAERAAARQGYKGARWPKMTSPDGHEGPSSIGVFLIWQQPHPIYYAELLYRSGKDSSILKRYERIVFETAEFMASYAHWDEQNGRYVLGPPLIPAQEIYKPDSTLNPGFELSYWMFGLKTAQAWRERLGLPRNEKWDHIINHLSKLPMNDGLYQNAEMAIDTFDDPIHRNDHPTLLGAYGMLPNDSVDVPAMERTLERVMQLWNWESTWGWDYPLIAMTAARVGRPDLAVDALLMDARKNTFLNNGHNYQNENLPVYLPGNGGLLAAVAMMAAGWDGCPNIPAPGFPKDEKWAVRWEGLERLP